MAEKIIFDKKDIEANRYIALLSYLWILCLIPLFLKKDSPFAQAHAKQGLILFILEVIGVLVFWIPFIGWLLWLALVVASLVGICQTISGRYFALPGLDKIRKKFNL